MTETDPPSEQPSEKARHEEIALSSDSHGITMTEIMGVVDELHKNAAVRFFSKVQKTETCWIWTASKNDRGYGYFRYNGKMGKAYRFSYEFHKGPIPEDRELDHLCRNPSCVNPDHLEAVTGIENQRRSPISLLTTEIQKTHCPKGHPYTPENIYTEKAGKARRCKICKLASNKLIAGRNIEKQREYARRSYHRKRLLSLKKKT